MTNSRPNRHHLKANFPIRHPLIASVLLGLLTTITTTANAQPLVTPLIAQAQNPSQSGDVQSRLIGQWQAKDTSSEPGLTLIFTADSKLFAIFPSDSGTPTARQLGYRINPTPQPMHIDVSILSMGDVVQTIFEFTPDGQLRLQIVGTEPGQRRPTTFTPSATVFQKISDATTLPSDVEVIDLQTEINQAQQAEGKYNIAAMSRAQQAYHLEFSKFGTTIEELGVGIKPETENYRYKIVPQGNQQERVMMTAQAKKPELRSYTSVVFIIKTNGDDLSYVGICETDNPSSTPPAMPTISRNKTGEIQCPAGSHQL
ncbi:MAG TPA: type IV pilin-like G/H family protein [Cyanophyceae cyanobacterium]